MQRYVAFLRGMNLGNRRIANAELIGHVEALGFSEVSTFRASGNVILADGGSEEEVAARLEQGLGERLGYEVPVFLRSSAELAAIVAAEPFDEAVIAATAGRQQVVFLHERPTAKAGREALALADEGERLVLAGRDLFWLPVGGLADADFDIKGLERLLGSTTIRTMGTVAQLAARAAG